MAEFSLPADMHTEMHTQMHMPLHGMKMDDIIEEHEEDVCDAYGIQSSKNIPTHSNTVNNTSVSISSNNDKSDGGGNRISRNNVMRGNFTANKSSQNDQTSGNGHANIDINTYAYRDDLTYITGGHAHAYAAGRSYPPHDHMHHITGSGDNPGTDGYSVHAPYNRYTDDDEYGGGSNGTGQSQRWGHRHAAKGQERKVFQSAKDVHTRSSRKKSSNAQPRSKKARRRRKGKGKGKGGKKKSKTDKGLLISLDYGVGQHVQHIETLRSHNKRIADIKKGGLQYKRRGVDSTCPRHWYRKSWMVSNLLKKRQDMQKKIDRKNVEVWRFIASSVSKVKPKKLEVRNDRLREERGSYNLLQKKKARESEQKRVEHHNEALRQRLIECTHEYHQDEFDEHWKNHLENHQKMSRFHDRIYQVVALDKFHQRSKRTSENYNNEGRKGKDKRSRFRSQRMYADFLASNFIPSVRGSRSSHFTRGTRGGNDWGERRGMEVGDGDGDGDGGGGGGGGGDGYSYGEYDSSDADRSRSRSKSKGRNRSASSQRDKTRGKRPRSAQGRRKLRRSTSNDVLTGTTDRKERRHSGPRRRTKSSKNSKSASKSMSSSSAQSSVYGGVRATNGGRTRPRPKSASATLAPSPPASARASTPALSPAPSASASASASTSPSQTYRVESGFGDDEGEFGDSLVDESIEGDELQYTQSVTEAEEADVDDVLGVNKGVIGGTRGRLSSRYGGMVSTAVLHAEAHNPHVGAAWTITTDRRRARREVSKPPSSTSVYMISADGHTKGRVDLADMDLNMPHAMMVRQGHKSRSRKEREKQQSGLSYEHAYNTENPYHSHAPKKGKEKKRKKKKKVTSGKRRSRSTVNNTTGPRSAGTDPNSKDGHEHEYNNDNADYTNYISTNHSNGGGGSNGHSTSFLAQLSGMKARCKREQVAFAQRMETKENKHTLRATEISKMSERELVQYVTSPSKQLLAGSTGGGLNIGDGGAGTDGKHLVWEEDACAGNTDTGGSRGINNDNNGNNDNDDNDDKNGKDANNGNDCNNGNHNDLTGNIVHTDGNGGHDGRGAGKTKEDRVQNNGNEEEISAENIESFVERYRQLRLGKRSIAPNSSASSTSLTAAAKAKRRAQAKAQAVKDAGAEEELAAFVQHYRDLQKGSPRPEASKGNGQRARTRMHRRMRARNRKGGRRRNSSKGSRGQSQKLSTSSTSASVSAPRRSRDLRPKSAPRARTFSQSGSRTRSRGRGRGRGESRSRSRGRGGERSSGIGNFGSYNNDHSSYGRDINGVTIGTGAGVENGVFGDDRAPTPSPSLFDSHHPYHSSLSPSFDRRYSRSSSQHQLRPLSQLSPSSSSPPSQSHSRSQSRSKSRSHSPASSSLSSAPSSTTSAYQSALSSVFSKLNHPAFSGYGVRGGRRGKASLQGDDRTENRGTDGGANDKGTNLTFSHSSFSADEILRQHKRHSDHQHHQQPPQHNDSQHGKEGKIKKMLSVDLARAWVDTKYSEHDNENDTDNDNDRHNADNHASGSNHDTTGSNKTALEGLVHGRMASERNKADCRNKGGDECEDGGGVGEGGALIMRTRQALHGLHGLVFRDDKQKLKGNDVSTTSSQRRYTPMGSRKGSKGSLGQRTETKPSGNNGTKGSNRNVERKHCHLNSSRGGKKSGVPRYNSDGGSPDSKQAPVYMHRSPSYGLKKERVIRKPKLDMGGSKGKTKDRYSPAATRTEHNTGVSNGPGSDSDADADAGADADDSTNANAGAGAGAGVDAGSTSDLEISTRRVPRGKKKINKKGRRGQARNMYDSVDTRARTHRTMKSSQNVSVWNNSIKTAGRAGVDSGVDLDHTSRKRGATSNPARSTETARTEYTLKFIQGWEAGWRELGLTPPPLPPPQTLQAQSQGKGRPQRR